MITSRRTIVRYDYDGFHCDQNRKLTAHDQYDLDPFPPIKIRNVTLYPEIEYTVQVE